MKRHSLAASAAVVVTSTIGLTGCSSDAETGGGATQETAATVTAPTAPQRVDAVRFAEVVATPGTRIIDVRTPEEYAQGHLEGAINLDVEGGEFEAGLADFDPTAAYSVYCRSGRRSAIAADVMAENGFTEVTDLGSLESAAAATGLPVTTG